jgi:hypothetical protein
MSAAVMFATVRVIACKHERMTTLVQVVLTMCGVCLIRAYRKEQTKIVRVRFTHVDANSGMKTHDSLQLTPLTHAAAGV